MSLSAPGRRRAIARTATRNAAATILELTGTSDEEVDVIEALIASARSGKVIAVTALDAKTIASVRRLFQAKSVDVDRAGRAPISTPASWPTFSRPSESQPAAGSRDAWRSAIARRPCRRALPAQGAVPRRRNENYGVEALCRIQHPELGMIYPDNFIPLAEAHDLILELTDAVTVQAFRDLRAWDEQGLQLRLAINISPRLMSGMTWFELFEHRCQEYQHRSQAHHAGSDRILVAGRQGAGAGNSFAPAAEGLPAVDRRFRHRLFLAGDALQAAVRRTEDRQGLCLRPAQEQPKRAPWWNPPSAWRASWA